MNLLNLLLITCMAVFVIDLSGFVDEMVKRLHKKYVKVGDYHTLLPKLKPFTCSLCTSFWAGIIYLIVTHSLTIPYIAFTCLLAFLTPVIGDFMMWVKEALTALINTFYKIWER